MKVKEQYLKVLVDLNEWTTVSSWAELVGETYPDVLPTADEQAANQKSETTGLRELAARISSCISNGSFGQQIEIDTSERPRKVRYLPDAEQQNHINADIEDDAEPLKRSEIISRDEKGLSPFEAYRITELESISKQLKTYFGLDFEVDHAIALLNKEQGGKHHPDNLQLLLKAHNAKKNSKNWPRFSIEEQKAYLLSAIKLQGIVATRMGFDLNDSILDSLLERLEKVYTSQ